MNSVCILRRDPLALRFALATGTDGFGVIERIAGEVQADRSKQGRAGFDRLAATRGLDIVTFRDWRKIEAAEIAAARNGSPREKFVDIAAMIAAGHD